MRRAFLLLALLLAAALLMPDASHAWDWRTHRAIAESVLVDSYPTCKERIDEGSVYPDQVLRDFVNHHCYASCPVSDRAFCPTKLDCPAGKKAQEFIARSQSQQGCDKAFSLAVATHYLADPYVPMHNLAKESYEGCHEPFEDRVGDAIEGKRMFPIVYCCDEPEACFSLTKQEFDAMLSSIRVRVGVQTDPSVPITGMSIYRGEFIDIDGFMHVLVMLIVVCGIVLGLRSRMRKKS